MPAVALLLLLCTACGPTLRAEGDAPTQPERARAALAAIVVDNRSPETLTISYRLTSVSAGETRIGSIPPDSIATMAPVPAGEPIILSARTAAGLDLILPPRTLRHAEAWVWTIPADASFGGGRVAR